MELFDHMRGNREIKLVAMAGKAPMIHHHEQVVKLVLPWRKRAYPVTLAAICARLEAKKIKTFRGRKWTPSRLSVVLKENSGIKNRKKDV